jgi:heat shock protein HtpX
MDIIDVNPAPTFFHATALRPTFSAFPLQDGGSLGVIAMLMQPFFYYAVAGLAVLVLLVWALLRHFDFLGSKIRSTLYLAPLFVPLIVYALINPSLTMFSFNRTISFGSHATNGLVSIGVIVEEVLNPVGIVVVTGLALGAVFFTIMILFGDRIGRRLLNVVDLDSHEFPAVRVIVKKVAKKAGTPTPKIGIIEDIEPKAFVTGWGRGTSLIFSLGLLQILSDQEIEAVVAHEISHIRNRDCFFELTLKVLRIVSFFNPCAYFAVSKALREREILADEQGAKLLKRPELLGTTLIKIWEALKAFPAERSLSHYAFSLFIVSPLWRNIEIFPSHPSLNVRLRKIIDVRTKTTDHHERIKTASVLVLIAIVGISMYYPLAYLHSDLITLTMFGMGRGQFIPFTFGITAGTAVSLPAPIELRQGLPVKGEVAVLSKLPPLPLPDLSGNAEIVKILYYNPDPVPGN